MPDLWGIIAPIVVSVIISLVGAYMITRYAGPAQAAYISALEGRLKVVVGERDDAVKEIPILKARILALEAEVILLKQAAIAKDLEVVDLYRRLDADEKRITVDEERERADVRRVDADIKRVHQDDERRRRG